MHLTTSRCRSRFGLQLRKRLYMFALVFTRFPSLVWTASVLGLGNGVYLTKPPLILQQFQGDAMRLLGPHMLEYNSLWAKFGPPPFHDNCMEMSHRIFPMAIFANGHPLPLLKSDLRRTILRMYWVDMISVTTGGYYLGLYDSFRYSRHGSLSGCCVVRFKRYADIYVRQMMVQYISHHGKA